MKKILILGGSFDPIHNGHLLIAAKAQEKLNLDEVWFMPLKNARWKNVQASEKDRVNMLKIALKGLNNFKVCDYELKHTKKGEKSYSIDTFKGLTKDYPDNEYYLLIGSDHLEILDKWKQIDELSKMIHLVAVSRPGYQYDKKVLEKYNVQLLDIKGPEVSSSQIRLFASDDMPKGVIKYIAENGLYLEGKLIADLSKERFDHSKRVATLAKKIARNNGYDPKKAYIAGILHDCAKEIPLEDAKELMKTFFNEYIDVPTKLYHQFLGVIVARDIFDIKDKEILQAIKFHTTGSTKMSKLDKIIFVADKIEPGRDYDSKDIINTCLENINKGFKLTLAHNVEYLLDVNKSLDNIHHLTIDTYKKYIKKEN